MKRALVLGGGGFIGSHLVKSLKENGYWVSSADLKYPEFWDTPADKFHIMDLRVKPNVYELFNTGFVFDEIYQLAADMGGAGYISTGDNDPEIMNNSVQINLNVLDAVVKYGGKKILYASSACVYPEYNQLDPNNPNCEESTVYPAQPDTEYGWEKLFSERMYTAYKKKYNLDVKIVRFHNIFGPYCTYDGGKEKAPAAICRKISQAKDNDVIEVWGNGEQTRSFLYIDECLTGIQKMMNSNFGGPVNIGSDEMVTINELIDIVSKISGKNINKKYVLGPIGVNGRNSDNNLIFKELNWKPSEPLSKGITKTYEWINYMCSNEL